jgi:hypothetical protein
MRLGAGLIALGALSIPLFQVSGVLEGQAATAAFAVVPDQDTVADDQHSAASGNPGNGQVRGGSAASIGQAGPPPPRGQ